MNAATIKSTDIRQAARGCWLSVLDNLAPEINQAVEKPGKKHIACPVHGGKDGFRLFRDANLSGGGICNTCGPKPDGFSLLMWLRGWTFPEALSAVADVLGVSNGPSKRIVQRKPHIERAKASVDDDKLKSLLRTVWQQSKSLHHPSARPVRLYLQSRGLDSGLPDWSSLRFHPNMQYRDEDNQIVGYFPAMLALVENGNQPITIHRTFLTHDGCKAPVESPKKLMPVPSDRSIVGSAVRLGQPGRVLCVTEGIETALAVIEVTGMITWPLISSTYMTEFRPPQGVEKLIIWSDRDRSLAGISAAQKLAERTKTQGIQVEIREPPGPLPVDAKSVDWLDVLNQIGPNAFAFRSVI